MPLPITRLHWAPLAWSLQATRAVHSRLHYHPREQQHILATPFLVQVIRKCCYLNVTLSHLRHQLCLYPFVVLRSDRCPPRPFLASPPSSSTSDAHETSVQFGGGGVNVSASSAPATTPPHLSQGAANPATMQPFTSSSEIWQPSHNTGVNLSPSPVTTTNVIGGIVASSLGENLKGRVMQGRSPTDSTRGSARYDPMGKQARFTSRASTSATPATAVAAPGSEQLTDEGDERDSDGSVRDVRDKKRKYAKTFRDMEKQLFEKLRHRLFPQDPHAKRSECLDRGMCGSDSHSHCNPNSCFLCYSVQRYRALMSFSAFERARLDTRGR